MSQAGKVGTGAALLLGLAALIVWASRAQATPGGQEGQNPAPGDDWAPGEGGSTVTTTKDPLSAFLYAIRTAEHGQSVPDGLRYFRFYSGIPFQGIADHPAATGEVPGVKLPDRYCRAAGFGPGCVSTAAGAYQIILPTWRRVREAGSWGPRLADFGVDSQDEAARRILLSAGALSKLQAGDVPGAIAAASSQWASLPGSTSGQPQRSMDTVLAYYQDGLNAQG